MNILLIGGSNNLTNRLIASFNKEGHRVSVLTGSYHTGKKYNRVFEIYNFPYSSNVLTEIFESVAPDLTLYMGIYDNNYKWEDIQKDSVEFITSFMNILNAYSALGRGRLVLLSSDAIYKDSLPYLIPEQTEPDANDLRGLALVEAESLCEKYRSVFGADILTIRLSGNYWQPKTLEDVGDPVSRMCLRVLKDGRVTTVSHRSIMLIHNSDAAFFISRLALTNERQHSVYNISSGVPISLNDLAAIVNESAEKVLEKTNGGKDKDKDEAEPENARSESGLNLDNADADADLELDDADTDADLWSDDSDSDTDLGLDDSGAEVLADTKTAAGNDIGTDKGRGPNVSKGQGIGRILGAFRNRGKTIGKNLNDTLVKKLSKKNDEDLDPHHAKHHEMLFELHHDKTDEDEYDDDLFIEAGLDDSINDELDLSSFAKDKPRTGAAVWPADEEDPEIVTIRSMGSDHGVEALAGTVQALLSTERYSKEFGINRLADLREKTEETIAYMLKHKAIFLADEEKEPGLLQIIANYLKELAVLSVPYIENFICFLIVFFASSYLKNSQFFSRIDLFLLYVMLFSILYGQTQGIVSAFLSIFSLLIPTMSNGSLSDILMDYSTYVWIAQLFIVGLVIGYLKDKLWEQKDEAKEDHEYMTTQVDDIRDINSTNSRVKDTLETQLINQENSVTKIYEITSELNQYHSVDVLFRATEMICRIMGSHDVSVYILNPGSRYARLFTATSERARQYGKSFVYKEESGDMYESFLKKTPYVNRTWDPKYPSIANLVYEGDIDHFVIMVWNLPLEKLNQGQANLLKVICLLTKESVFRAQRYYEAIQHEQHVPDTDVLLREPFKNMVDTYDAAAARHLTDFMVLRVMQLPGGIKPTADRLREHIRPNDFLGLGLRDDAIYVLLSNTTSEEGEAVIKRLASYGFTSANANHELI